MELQVVQFVLIESGFRAIVPQLVLALRVQPVNVLAGIIRVINNEINLSFLDSAVNNAVNYSQPLHKRIRVSDPR